MAYIISKLWSFFNYAFDEAIDPRTKDFLFVGKPFQILVLLVVYNMFVFRWGPQWMKNRPPYNIDKLVMAYDLIQIIACSWVFCKALSLTWLSDYKLICEPVDYSYSEKALGVARAVHCYFLLKIVDLLDTIFFTLRKKSNQVTFLHVYHHTAMVLGSWMGINYLPGGHGILFGIINLFVHAIMYSYYLLTLVKPESKKYIWLKKIVTQVQIVQFLIGVVHMGASLFVPNCAYPKWVLSIFLPNNAFMLVLFSDFYIKNYIKNPKIKA